MSSASKYGFEPEWAGTVCEYIQKVNITNPFRGQWDECTVYYDAEKDSFIAWNGLKSFFSIKRVIPDSDVTKAIENLHADLSKQLVKHDLLNKYADAVSYYHNDPKIDNKGIFIKSGPLSKRYFSMAELDDMKENYEKKKLSLH